jgi:oligopeptide/dipeptide ABC transporter ATP-binding protein
VTGPAEPELSVRDLVIRFAVGRRVVHAVNGVSFDVERGESVGLAGESGSGKSATSLAVMRLLPRPAGRIVRGDIRFEGTDLLGLSEPAMRRLRGRDISMVLQDPQSALNPVLTVGEQIEEAIRAHDDPGRRAAERKAEELLRLVDIPRPREQLERYPHQFSGGMRQRVMIAIALALQPKVLIADEPTTALDVTVQAQVLELLRKLTAEMGTAIVLITHDLGILAGMTRRISVMYAGFVVEAAPTGLLFAEPRHPYTVGLLRSIPRRGARGQSLTPIEGNPPDQERAPVGCPFAPRCAWRVEACWREMPPLVPTGDAAHLLACHNPVQAGEAQAGRPLRASFQPAPPPTAVELSTDGIGGP